MFPPDGIFFYMLVKQRKIFYVHDNSECRHQESVRTSADHAAGVWQGDGGGAAQGLAGLQRAEDVPILEEPEVEGYGSHH